MHRIRGFLQHYGMSVVLVILCLFFSVVTIERYAADSPSSAKDMVQRIADLSAEQNQKILIVGAQNTASALLAQRVADLLIAEGRPHQLVLGTPQDLRVVLEEESANGSELAALAIGGEARKWRLVELIPERFPSLAEVPIVEPKEGWRSGFLSGSNLIAIVDRIVVIAVIAIGMTLVIITGGIDLSVGSLIALAAVVSTFVMKALGGLDAAPWCVALGFLVSLLVCSFVGLITGTLVAWTRVAPFIVTLGFMMIARGQ
ncbi:MAG: ABC transporter permease, partial [Verrucomicrobiota bacterium]